LSFAEYRNKYAKQICEDVKKEAPPGFPGGGVEKKFFE
jgi:hypothetical protein